MMELLPRRYLLAIISFFGFANIYALRVNLSVALIAMTSNTTTYVNATKVIRPPEFNWDDVIQGIVLSSFFYGYILTQIIGGWLTVIYGGKNLFGLGVGVTAFITLLTPFLARSSVYLLVMGRVVEGLFEGVTFPAMHGMWSKWSPPEERSRLVSVSYSGAYFGTVAALPLCGAFADRLGWPAIFYIFGAIGVFWTFLWFCLVSNSPTTDRWISASERDLLTSSINSNSFVNRKVEIPWKDIMCSLPVWAIIVAHFTENWGFYTLLVELPKYMDDTFGFSMQKAGLLASLPYLVLGIIYQGSGFLADWFRSSGILSTMQVRKLFTCTAFMTRALFLLLATYSGSPTGIITSLTIAVGFGGLSSSGFACNHLDIAPIFASVLMGISNTVATLPGIISPLLTGEIVRHKKAGEWQIIFYISSALYIFGAFIYGLTASGKVQRWANINIDQSFLSDHDINHSSCEDLLPSSPPNYQSVR